MAGIGGARSAPGVACYARWTGDPRSADGDLVRRIAGRAVGDHIRLHARLRVARLVGRPRFDEVVAGRHVDVPVVDPLPPCIEVGYRRQPGLPPRSVRDPDLDRLDAFVLRPGDAGDRDLLARLDGRAGGRDVDPGLGLHRRL